MLPALFHPTVQISPAVGFKSLTFEKYLPPKEVLVLHFKSFCASNFFPFMCSPTECNHEIFQTCWPMLPLILALGIQCTALVDERMAFSRWSGQ